MPNSVFISYAQQDADIARQLTRALNDSGIADVFFDRAALRPGSNWHLEVANALERANVMVVLVSPESMASEWVRQEINLALTSPRFEGRVVPIEIRPTHTMPWILEQLQILHFDKDAETNRRQLVDRMHKLKTPA
jgi:hypothetical protein